MNSQRKPTLSAALAWAKAGWPVFPLKPGGKYPLCTHGHLDATRDPEQIRKWWARWPYAEVGGRTDGLVVVDLDPYQPGHAEELASLRADGLELAPTRQHTSAQGGTHHIYRNTTGLPPEQIRGALAASVDIKREDRGYIVLPSGNDGRRVASDVPPAPVPGGLAALLRKPDGPDALAEVPQALPLPGTLPPAVRRAQEAQQSDRSSHTWRLMVAGYAAGLSHGQVRTLLEQDPVTAERWGERPHLPYLELTETLARARAEAQRSREPAASPEEEPVEQDPQDAYPCLPDEFWEARPELAQIRQAARSRMVAPDATLAGVLARVSALVHFRHQLPPIIGGHTSLDLLVAVISEPGFGKGGAMAVAGELVPGCNREDGYRVRTMALGSTEGMVGSYFETVEDEEEGPHLARVYNGVLFSCDEGSSYKALSERSTQTTSETIRQMFKGERLGNTYTGRSKLFQIPELCYRAAIVMALQPVHAHKLLGEWDAGTPLRFLWTTARDPDMPDEQPGWPGKLGWRPPAADKALDPAHSHGRRPVRVARTVAAEIRQHHRAKHVGEWDPGRYDAHRDLVRLKVAALLGCLRTGLPEASRSDWELAGTVLGTSDRIRGWMLHAVADAAEQERAGRISFRADAAGAARSAELLAESDYNRVRNVLLRAHKRHPELTASALVKRTGRDHRLARQILPELVAEGTVSWPEDDTDDTNDTDDTRESDG